jgi:isopentenyl-diphosphate delta-isomerase
MTEEQVILVDIYDNPIGTMGKLEVHEKGILHRAFSVFIFNDQNELLLQRRALSKYHSAGLWTNTCCSHPRPNEDTMAAANRRLLEEMGMVADLTHKSSFIYKTPFDNDLTEHEFDHVFVGCSNTEPIINLGEVDSFKWMLIEDVKSDIKKNPNHYTSWFKIAIETVF